MANGVIQIVIDGDPVAKGRGRVGKLANGKATVFTPTKTKSYEGHIQNKSREVMKHHCLLDEPLIVSLTVFVALPKYLAKSKAKKAKALSGELLPDKRPDIDNYIKSALDGMNGVVFRDDSLITSIVAHKKYSEKPCLDIYVQPISARRGI